tara:strand:+ start:26600 stop:27238 length:639 start_codon:yes stop_codon:yes gene_type:complete
MLKTKDKIMKKILALSALMLGLVTPLQFAMSQGQPSDGFYVGIDGSFDQLKDNINATPDNIYNADGPAVGLFAGYRQSQGRFTVAAEARYGYSFASEETTVAPIDGFALTHEFGAAVLPGFWVNDQLIVYGRIGFTNATLVDTISDIKFTNTDSAVEYGGGVEIFASETVSVRVEYTRVKFEGMPILTFNAINYSDWGITRNRFRAAITTAF